jgi:hypothetical protein
MKVLRTIAVIMIVSMLSCKKDSTGGGPKVLSADPSQSQTGVARNKDIEFTFSEAMDPSTINNSTFTVMQGSTVVPGTVVYSELKQRLRRLRTGARYFYTATITTGAKMCWASIPSNSVLNFTTGSTSTLNAVDLGAAGNYVIFAKTAINNSSTSAVTGDLGLSPAATSYITGFALTNATGYATSILVTGKIYAADMAVPTPSNMTTAVNNMITAYKDAAGRPSPDFTELGTGNLGGKTLIPGLYKWSSTVIIPSDVTLEGDANAVWIFQIAGNLTMSSAMKVNSAEERRRRIFSGR